MFSVRLLSAASSEDCAGVGWDQSSSPASPASLATSSSASRSSRKPTGPSSASRAWCRSSSSHEQTHINWRSQNPNSKYADRTFVSPSQCLTGCTNCVLVHIFQQYHQKRCPIYSLIPDSVMQPWDLQNFELVHRPLRPASKQPRAIRLTTKVH